MIHRAQTVSGGETTNYTYNIANLLTSQTTGDKMNEQYTYYLNGNQKTKTSNGILTASSAVIGQDIKMVMFCKYGLKKECNIILNITIFKKVI